VLPLPARTLARMPESLNQLLEREYAYVARQDGRDFYLQIAPYLNVLAGNRRLRKLITKLEREAKERLDRFVAEQNVLIEEAKQVRFELAQRAPEIDKSDMERPDPASHARARYDLNSFARFDELTGAEIRIGYPTVPKDTDDPGPVSTLLIILRGRLNAAQHGEDGSPLGDENRRPDLDDLWTRINNVQERHTHVLRAYRQDSRGLPGLAYGRLRYFGSELNPAPVIIESEADRLRLIEEAILDFGSPKRLVQKLVNGERFEDWEERYVGEFTANLKAEAERLHQELLRGLALAPRGQKAWAYLSENPLAAGIVATVFGGLILAAILALVL
jgi:hypothetical protein